MGARYAFCDTKCYLLGRPLRPHAKSLQQKKVIAKLLSLFSVFFPEIKRPCCFISLSSMLFLIKKPPCQIQKKSTVATVKKMLQHATSYLPGLLGFLFL